jgi:ABC-2 type transport system ATP-binding protein
MPAGPALQQTGYALELVDLRREFADKVAVDDVTLRVPHGSFYGLVGPNGAGKTTALSMAVGLLRPSSGSAFVEGVDVWADPVSAKRHLGVLPDGSPCPSGSAAASCWRSGAGSAGSTPRWWRAAAPS